MFERYTEKARRTIFFARYEAAQHGWRYITGEALLLGLLREAAAQIPSLRDSGLRANIMREMLASLPPATEKISTTVDLPLDNAAKRILAYAAEEAERMSHRHIGSEHLLLGLLREGGTTAAHVLQTNRITLEHVREDASAAPSVDVPRYRRTTTGAPGDSQLRRFLFNPTSQSLIVEVQHFSRAGAISRISVRHKDVERYEFLDPRQPNLYYESPVTSVQRPILFFLLVEWREGVRSPSHILAYNLETKQVTIAFPETSLVVEGPHLRAFIDELLTVSADDTTLYCRLAVEHEIPTGSRTEYSLAAIHLEKKTVQVISALRERWY